MSLVSCRVLFIYEKYKTIWHHCIAQRENTNINIYKAYTPSAELYLQALYGELGLQLAQPLCMEWLLLLTKCQDVCGGNTI